MRGRAAEVRQRASGGRDAGETLIELLIATLVMSITVAALLNSLIESSSASVEHRSLASLDTVLRSFADAATYQIQMQPVTASAGPSYAPSASTTGYSVLSAPIPSAGPPQTSATVFATGLSSPVSSVSLAPTSAPTDETPATISSVKADTGGDATVTFLVPVVTAGSYLVSVTESSGDSLTANEYFDVTSGSTAGASSLANYQLSISEVDWWNQTAGAFEPDGEGCVDSGIQMLTLTASAADGTTSTLQFVVTDPKSEDPQIVAPNGTAPPRFGPGDGSIQLVQVTGHPQPVLTCSVVGTTCTAIGLSISQMGVLSYTQTAGAGGSYQVTITATNPANDSTSQLFTIVIGEPPGLPPSGSATFTAGQSNQHFTVSATTGYPPPTYSLNGNPSWLSISSSTGVATGSPPNNVGMPHVYTFTVIADNGVGTDATENFTLTVTQKPQWNPVPTSPFNDSKSHPTSLTLTADPGYPTGPLKYSVVSGNLDGLTLNGSTGVLSGTPTATGNFNVRFRATNQTTLQFTVNATVMIHVTT